VEGQKEIINNTDWELLPYTVIDGIPTFNDSFIKSIFDRMEGEQLVDTVFYDGEVKTPEDFLHMMKHGINNLFVIAKNDRSDIGGIVWLNNFQSRSGCFHFCFFENIKGLEALDVGEYASFFVLNLKNKNGDYLFDVLTGVVPDFNRSARNWCLRVGYKKVGVVPQGVYIASLKKSIKAHIFYAERSEYNGWRRR
jgi:hypothetical protein